MDVFRAKHTFTQSSHTATPFSDNAFRKQYHCFKQSEGTTLMTP